MKLNPDCVRSVLLYAEDNADPDSPWCVSKSGESQLPLFTASEVWYHVRQCVNAGLLFQSANWIDDTLEISDLTPAGHQALAALRNPRVHEKARCEWLSKVRDGLISASTAQFVSVAMEILQSAHPS